MASFAQHIIGPDTHANRPAAGSVPAGTVYACTDHSKLEQSSGSAWSDYFAGGAGGVTVQDEGSPLSTAGTTLNFTGAGVTASGTGATKTVNIPGGGGGSASYEFLFDVPPGSAHAKDDEFTAGSLDAKWTSPISSGTGLGVTTTLANDWLAMEPTTSGTASTSKHLFGIRQASPTGSFTIMCKINGSVADVSGSDSYAGLLVARTADSKAHLIGRNANGPNAYRFISFDNYSETADAGAYNGSVNDGANDLRGPYWYRLVWDSAGGTIAASYSLDGTEWTAITSRTSQSQPDRIGLAIYSNGGTIRANHILRAAWFRVTEP